MKKIKILTVFGTRPEVIKLASFIQAVEADLACMSVTCATTQHRELQNDVLTLFNITPTYNLDIMRENQELAYVTSKVLEGLTRIITQENPNFVVVQGDTTTAFAASLAAFYQKVPVVHIEAGLRTGNMFSPFPEEANRKLISQIATFHMAPTKRAEQNLINEEVQGHIFMMGNTIVDSVHWGLQHFTVQDPFIHQITTNDKKTVLITVHRRENFGKPLEEICLAIKRLCVLYPSYQFIWPVHPNPNVYSIVQYHLQNPSNLYFMNPLSYNDLLTLINHSTLLISDSGGIQEEAAILGKKIIVLREETERMEIIEAGIGVLVGSNKEKIVEVFCKMVDFCDTSSRECVQHIYGAQGVSKNILGKIKNYFNLVH